MILYLIRHGRTEDHVNNIRQAPHSPLGEYGLSQARAVAKRFKGVKFDHLYSSDLHRARQTAEEIARETAMEVKIDQLFREAAKSKILEGAPIEGEINKRFAKEKAENRENFDWKFEGEGESMNELIERAKKVLKYLVENHESETIAIVSHAYLIGAVTGIILLGEDYEKKSFSRLMLGLSLENTGVCSFEYKPVKKQWKLICFNDHSHLADFME